tara:strand:- start:1447 stop:2451 length:1005 start_codon:yes stop_codon:yes gene_type:complete
LRKENIILKVNSNITKNVFTDNLFIFYPLWFPIIYLLVIVNFPSIAPFLFLSVLFLFAETHFASTWLFFFDRENWKWIKENSYKLFILPIYLLLAILLIWKFNNGLVLIFHYLASGWHVTKQSIGIQKLSKNNNFITSFLTYGISFFCLGIGLANPGILSFRLSDNLVNLILFTLMIFYLLSIIKISDSGKGFFSFLTGVFIYLPLLFIDNLALATSLGVGMHWCQYLALMWSIKIKKRNEVRNKMKNEIKNSSKFFHNLKINLVFVMFYSFVMTYLAYLGMPSQNFINRDYSIFYVIPIIFQLYHFYIDGFIWQFSNKHIKKSVGSYIFSKQT